MVTQSGNSGGDYECYIWPRLVIFAFYKCTDIQIALHSIYHKVDLILYGERRERVNDQT